MLFSDAYKTWATVLPRDLVLLTVAAVRATVPSTPCLRLRLNRGPTFPHSQESNPGIRKVPEKEGKVGPVASGLCLFSALKRTISN